MNNTRTQLSETVKAEIDKWLTKFPADQKQSAVLYALRMAQEENGWLTEPLMEAVATYLDMPVINVFEVATFYNMYDLKPVGKHKINVCGSISCILCGSEKIVSYLEKKLNIKTGETTQDGQFTLKHAECLGACRNAPMMQIDKIYYEDLTPEKVDAILAELKTKGEA